MYRLLYLAFFVSGLGSLGYELLWQRMLSLTFGASATATTAVFTAFFIGFGVGGLFGTKLLKKFKSTFVFYGYLEIFIALSALLFPAFLIGANYLYVQLPSHFLIHFALSVLCLFPATFAMGATIPTMNKLINELGASISNSVALSYGINTLGAVLGIIISGFVLLPNFGLENSCFVLIGCNLLVAAISFYLHKKKLIVNEVTPDAHINNPHLMKPKKIMIYFFIGFLSLGLEVVFFRVLAIVTTNSLLTFSMGLMTFLVGLSLGSLILFTKLKKKFSSEQILQGSVSGYVLSVGVILILIPYFPLVNLALIKWLASSFTVVISVELLFALVLFFTPALFLGVCFPAVCDWLIKDSKELSQGSGTLYFFGNIGGALGSILMGLFFIPLIHIHGSLLLLLAMGITIVVIIDRHQIKLKMFSVLLFSLCSGLYFFIQAKPIVRTDKLVKIDDLWQLDIPKQYKNKLKILKYKAGRSATVTVKEDVRPKVEDTTRQIFVDDQLVASTDIGAKVDAKALAHIPLLLHPEPKKALTVGFGSGGTSWSMTTHNVDTVAVEIEEEVIKSAHLFKKQNYDVLNHPKFSYVIEDARQYLFRTKEKFDVISTDATNLQYKQNSSLYTKEYFQLMKERLTKNGIACAWIPTYAITTYEFKILLRTFQAVYPHSSLWIIDHVFTSFALLVGTPDELSIDLNYVKERMKDTQILEDMNKIGVEHPYLLPNFVYLNGPGMKKYTGSGPLHTDDLPVLEFHSIQSFYIAHKDFIKRMQEIYFYRPKNREHVVSNLESDEVDLFRKFSALSRLMEPTTYEIQTGKQVSPQLQRQNLNLGLQIWPEFQYLNRLLRP